MFPGSGASPVNLTTVGQLRAGSFRFGHPCEDGLVSAGMGEVGGTKVRTMAEEEKSGLGAQTRSHFEG